MPQPALLLVMDHVTMIQLPLMNIVMGGVVITQVCVNPVLWESTVAHAALTVHPDVLDHVIRTQRGVTPVMWESMVAYVAITVQQGVQVPVIGTQEDVILVIGGCLETNVIKSVAPSVHHVMM